MTVAIDIRELAARLDELLALAAAGRVVVLNDGPVPRARVLPVAPPAERVPGLHPGALVPTADFDDPLPGDFRAGSLTE